MISRWYCINFDPDRGNRMNEGKKSVLLLLFFFFFFGLTSFSFSRSQRVKDNDRIGRTKEWQWKFEKQNQSAVLTRIHNATCYIHVIAFIIRHRVQNCDSKAINFRNDSSGATQLKENIVYFRLHSICITEKTTL